MMITKFSLLLITGIGNFGEGCVKNIDDKQLFKKKKKYMYYV